MKRITALLLFAVALVLSTYGVTRSLTAVRIREGNISAYYEYAKAEMLLQNQVRIAREEQPAGWKAPAHVDKLFKRLAMPDGTYAFLDGMIACLAGAAVLAAVGLYVWRSNKELRTSA